MTSLHSFRPAPLPAIPRHEESLLFTLLIFSPINQPRARLARSSRRSPRELRPRRPPHFARFPLSHALGLNRSSFVNPLRVPRPFSPPLMASAQFAASCPASMRNFLSQSPPHSSRSFLSLPLFLRFCSRVRPLRAPLPRPWFLRSRVSTAPRCFVPQIAAPPFVVPIQPAFPLSPAPSPRSKLARFPLSLPLTLRFCSRVRPLRAPLLHSLFNEFCALRVLHCHRSTV